MIFLTLWFQKLIFSPPCLKISATALTRNQILFVLLTQLITQCVHFAIVSRFSVFPVPFPHFRGNLEIALTILKGVKELLKFKIRSNIWQYSGPQEFHFSLYFNVLVWHQKKVKGETPDTFSMSEFFCLASKMKLHLFCSFIKKKKSLIFPVI